MKFSGAYYEVFGQLHFSKPFSEPMAALDGVLSGSFKDMLDQVSWYARVLKEARQTEERQAA